MGKKIVLKSQHNSSFFELWIMETEKKNTSQTDGVDVGPTKKWVMGDVNWVISDKNHSN